MDYRDISTELKHYYVLHGVQANLGKLKSSFFTTSNESFVFNIHENDVYSLTNMKTSELWTNVELSEQSDGTFSV